MNLKQQVDKLDPNFIVRFIKKVKKCSIQSPYVEYASMAINYMHPKLKEKLIGQACHDLNEMDSRGSYSFERNQRGVLAEIG
jgi:hypothetical protein